jgi:hypothetical protein
MFVKAGSNTVQIGWQQIGIAWDRMESDRTGTLKREERGTGQPGDKKKKKAEAYLMLSGVEMIHVHQ